MARTQPDFASVLAAIPPADSVLHLTIVADALRRRTIEMGEDAPSTWQGAVASLNRCVGALEHEVANIGLTIVRLIELIDVLRQDVTSSAQGDERFRSG